MQPDGQLYFDDEDKIPKEDLERYRKAIEQEAEGYDRLARDARAANEAMKRLSEKLKDDSNGDKMVDEGGPA